MSPERPGGSEKKIKGTTVVNVESTLRLLIPALDESCRFFSEDSAPFEVPDEFFITEERLREIGFTRAEPLVLPQRTLLENDPFWEGKVKPGPLFWESIQNGNLKPESAILQKGFYLIDGRSKPDDDYGEQRYEEDWFMEGLIEELRRKGAIRRNKLVPEDSRFGASAREIEQVILPEFARTIGKEALGSEGRVLNNPYKIFNIVGNMRHPEWGDTDTSEWFGDKFWSDYSYLGGCGIEDNGLAELYYRSSDRRLDMVGFRPLIFFPSKT